MKSNPTQSDVAAAAGVSRGLVSLALSGSPNVARETAQRIREVAHQMGYRLNAQASALASRHTGLMGLVLPNLLNPFFDALAQALQERARQEGFALLTVLEGQGVVETMERLRVEGLVAVSPTADDEELRQLGERLPLCVVGRVRPGGSVDAVRVDEDVAARVVLDHVVSLGARALVYAVLGEAGRSEIVRGGALKKQARARGLDFVQVGRENAREAVASREAAVLVAHNDLVAIDEAAWARGRIPLVSYDDTFLAQRPEFDLTSVSQPTDVMATLVISLLKDRIGGEEGQPGREECIGARLVVRSSSRPGSVA